MALFNKVYLSQSPSDRIGQPGNNAGEDSRQKNSKYKFLRLDTSWQVQMHQEGQSSCNEVRKLGDGSRTGPREFRAVSNGECL